MDRRHFLKAAATALVAAVTGIGTRPKQLTCEEFTTGVLSDFYEGTLGIPWRPKLDSYAFMVHLEYFLWTEHYDRGLPGRWSGRNATTWLPAPRYHNLACEHASMIRKRLAWGGADDRRHKAERDAAATFVEVEFRRGMHPDKLLELARQYIGIGSYDSHIAGLV